jgi:AraC-like DNA-binding protein
MIYYETERANPANGIYHQHNHNLSFFRHLHDSFEWIYVSEGAVVVTVDDRDLTVKAGQGLLIFPNQIHNARTPVSSRTYLCVFQNSLVGEFSRTAKVTVARNPVFDVPDPTLAERLQRADGSRYLLKSCLYELVDLLERSGDGYLPRNNKPAEHVGRILTFIARHYAEPITMQDAAREIGYDYHYLSNLLQKSLHTTFRTLLNEYRISHAQNLLLTGEGTVAAVAAECGYDSLCSFNRNFKAITGKTPTEYRERKAK